MALGWPGTTSHPATFAHPVLRRTVPGAEVDAVLRAPPALGAAYAAAARSLEADGATAIVANCGFAVVYQAVVSRAVGVPVATSSLLLLPLLAGMLPAGRAVGVVTFDARRLGSHHLACAGLRADAPPVVVTGIEGSESWRELGRREPRLTPAAVERDVAAAVAAMLAAHPEVAVLLLECGAFCQLRAPLRSLTGRPVFDLVALADLVMAGAGGVAGLGLPSRG